MDDQETAPIGTAGENDKLLKPLQIDAEDYFSERVMQKALEKLMSWIKVQLWLPLAVVVLVGSWALIGFWHVVETKIQASINTRLQDINDAQRVATQVKYQLESQKASLDDIRHDLDDFRSILGDDEHRFIKRHVDNLSDPDIVVVYTSIMQLIPFGSKARTAVPPLIAWLHERKKSFDDDPSLRYRTSTIAEIEPVLYTLIKVIGADAKPASDALFAMLPVSQQTSRICDALKAIGVTDAEIIDAVVKCVSNSTDLDARLTLLRALSRLELASASPHAVAQVKDALSRLDQSEERITKTFGRDCGKTQISTKHQNFSLEEAASSSPTLVSEAKPTWGNEAKQCNLNEVAA